MEPADIDADGDTDLLVGRYDILINDGAGGMRASWIQGPGYSQGVAAGDWDQDGDVDLAWAIFQVNKMPANQVALAYNTNGSFQMGPSVTVGSYPCDMISDDFDGDGAADLAVTDVNDATVSVLLNSGSDAFVERDMLRVGAKPCQLAAADYDRDGALDVAVTNGGSGTVSLLMGDGQRGLLDAISTLVVANQTIFQDAARPSYLSLPVVEGLF